MLDNKRPINQTFARGKCFNASFPNFVDRRTLVDTNYAFSDERVSHENVPSDSALRTCYHREKKRRNRRIFFLFQRTGRALLFPMRRYSPTVGAFRADRRVLGAHAERECISEIRPRLRHNQWTMRLQRLREQRGAILAKHRHRMSETLQSSGLQ